MRLVSTFGSYLSWLGLGVRIPGLENKYPPSARMGQVIGL